MKILSLDIETTSIERENGQLLSLGAVFKEGNGEEKKFYGAIDHKYFRGEPYALYLNAELLKEISRGKIEGGIIFDSELHLVEGFLRFLQDITKPGDIITLCGKNLERFDLKWLDAIFRDLVGCSFVEKVTEFVNGGSDTENKIKFSRRILDVGAMYANINDIEVPNLETCLSRAGIGKAVTHNALQDAEDTLNCAIHRLNQNLI